MKKFDTVRCRDGHVIRYHDEAQQEFELTYEPGEVRHNPRFVLVPMSNGPVWIDRDWMCRIEPEPSPWPRRLLLATLVACAAAGVYFRG